VTEARKSRIYDLVALEPSREHDPAGTAGTLVRLCRGAARALPGAGSSVSLMTESGSVAIVASSDKRSALIEECQFTMGEGPSWDAFETRCPVLAPDLVRDSAALWPGYVAAASEAGARSVFAFPLIVGSARMGVFGFYREEEGDLHRETIADALAFADLATSTLLDGQESGEGLPLGGPHDMLDSGLTVYQAQGMVMIQLGVSLTEATSRLRAHAYAASASLGAVSRDVVARRLSLERDTP